MDFSRIKASLKDLEKDRIPLVLICCGSFSPITFLHLRIFEIARDYFRNLKKFQVVGGIISPVSDGYGKESLVSAEHRVEMCKLACEDNPLLTVDGWEAMNPSWTSTLQVLKHFKSEFDSENLGQIRLCLLAGSDLLDGIDNPTIWNPNEVSELLDSFGIAVIERNPAVPLINKLFTSNVLYPHITNIFIISQFVPNDVSSSKIRLLLKRGHSIRYLTSDRVIEYIYKNNLYSK